jgi:hypothetical protein
MLCLIKQYAKRACGRWNFSSTHCWHRHYKEMTGHLPSPAAFTPGGTALGPHRTGGWVDPTSGHWLFVKIKKKISCRCREPNNSVTVQHVTLSLYAMRLQPMNYTTPTILVVNRSRTSSRITGTIAIIIGSSRKATGLQFTELQKCPSYQAIQACLSIFPWLTQYLETNLYRNTSNLRCDNSWHYSELKFGCVLNSRYYFSLFEGLKNIIFLE